MFDTFLQANGCALNRDEPKNPAAAVVTFVLL